MSNITEHNCFEILCSNLFNLDGIVAIALGGSRATKAQDSKSDYDLYVYYDTLPKTEDRHNAIKECCEDTEIGNTFFEFEDDCTLINHIDIDIIYRKLSDFKKEIESVVFLHQAHNAYTTCMWHNLINCQILKDTNNILKDFQASATISYPPELKVAITKNGLQLLSGSLPSYDKQIIKASYRGDFLSVNHRIAAYVETYFDVLFALNEMTHPGEKRMLAYALKAKKQPKNFKSDLEQLISLVSSNDTPKLESVLKALTTNLQELVDY